MVMVIVQHAYLNVDETLVPKPFASLIWLSTAFAAVAFVSISGLVMGCFYTLTPRWTKLYKKTVKRGLVLLVVAHPLINALSYFFRMAHQPDLYGHLPLAGRVFLDFPVTDTIAVCLLISPVILLLRRASVQWIVVCVLLLGAQLVPALTPDSGPTGSILKEVFLGTAGESPTWYWFPLLPWIAIFLSGVGIGRGMAEVAGGGRPVSTFNRQMLKTAVVLALISVALTLGHHFLERAVVFTGWRSAVMEALRPRQHTGLFPGYLSILLFLYLAASRRLSTAKTASRTIWILSVFGRTSLFTFVIQYAVVESIPALLGLTTNIGVGRYLVLLAAGLLTVWGLAYGYGRMRGSIQKDDFVRYFQQQRI